MLSSKKHVNVRPKQVSNILKKKKSSLTSGNGGLVHQHLLSSFHPQFMKKKIIYDFNHVF